MKKILITGAAGTIGLLLIKNLLAEGKYEITVLDLKNKNSVSKLKRYRKRINVVYGDILNRNMVEPLIKESDIVIHLASCLPPLAEMKKGLSDIIEFKGTENLVRAINYYNPSCHIIYASSTSLYSNLVASTSDKILKDEEDYYNLAKKKTEDLIIKKCQNYTIIRTPLVLGDLCIDPMIYNIKKDSLIEFITKEDAALAFNNAVDKLKQLNNTIINIGGGEKCQIVFSELLKKINSIHGITLNMILTRMFIPKNYRSPILADSSVSNKLLKYQRDSLSTYIQKQSVRSRKRKINKFIYKLVARRGKKWLV